uniref:Uncharacterized protein n=1 Tax=Coccidioides posadasii RMSCC 3488 TaxID=454284 RepID=A0A0J6FEB9_COCPO|nr:hypothetical protein CPAG_04974 [Coccidioides posadasii RMSCC 3488]
MFACDKEPEESVQTRNRTVPVVEFRCSICPCPSTGDTGQSARNVARRSKCFYEVQVTILMVDQRCKDILLVKYVCAVIQLGSTDKVIESLKVAKVREKGNLYFRRDPLQRWHSLEACQ